ncbi:hypothetical protein LIER_41805 [Lithospermum erythrorhizon]|uniref:Uncharacterized protein n=1 Tax=Lithospermum erythrorhizon TaxID=34254 RepID=A0AAV3RIE8_LITER
MERFGGVDRHLSFSLSEAYQFVDERVPYWATIHPSCSSPHVFTDDQLDSEEDMAFFLSLHTNMVGYREDAFFLLEAYNPHRFARQLGFSPSIPGFKSRSRDTLLASEGLSFWRSCVANRLGQSVTFPSALKAHGFFMGYSA